MSYRFRNHLKPQEEFGPSGEGQQQNLRVYFSGIYSNVRQLLQTRINGLETRHRETKNATLKAEIDRLVAEFERMPERWKFVESVSLNNYNKAHPRA